MHVTLAYAPSLVLHRLQDSVFAADSNPQIGLCMDAKLCHSKTEAKHHRLDLARPTLPPVPDAVLRLLPALLLAAVSHAMPGFTEVSFVHICTTVELPCGATRGIAVD